MGNRGNASRCHGNSADVARRPVLPRRRGRTSTRARIGLWGTSLGAHERGPRRGRSATDVAAAVVQCPIVHGPGAARSLGRPRPAAADAGDRRRTACAWSTRRGRRYVPIVGPPGSSRDGHGRRARRPAGTPPCRPGGAFDNRIAAADAVAMVTTSALRHARRVKRAAAGVRVRPRESDGSRGTRSWSRGGRRAGVARHYDSDHFDDLPSAAGQPGARRPDRLLHGAPRCPTRDLLRPTTIGSCALAADSAARRVGARPACATTWTNHDVLAHLVIGYRRRGSASCVAEMVRHRGGSFDRANTALACALAADRGHPPNCSTTSRGWSTDRAGIGRYFPRAAAARRPRHPRTRHPVRARPGARRSPAKRWSRC